ncbi:hypothetical protein GUJ93_ZPchr0014g46947 [Zizania palustris]|uniref:Uncharacterized protein n=1 Tax=Zizania palustris TaxID=103762 RepID=A0A8J5VS19_ZIZPA|nr:hypothetical protein GUJ93_ZPchr0014g46947 [Zizania palustris]
MAVTEIANDLLPQGLEGYEHAELLKNVAGEEKSMKENDAPQNKVAKHTGKKRLKDDDGIHEDGLVETSKMEKASTSKSILEKIQPAGHASQEKFKKAKKAKKASSVDMASLDVAGEKHQCGYGEDAAKSGRFATQGEIVNVPLEQQISSNVQPENSNIMENPCGGGRQGKKKKSHSKSSKVADPTHDVTKPSGFITNEISIQNTNTAPLGPKPIIPATIGEGTGSDQKKFDESLDVAADNVIVEVLADLRSKDHVSKDLDEHMSTEQSNRDSNQDVLGLRGNTGNKGVISAALPPKYLAALHSDAPIRSPSRNKAKGKQLKVLPTMHDSSYFSGGVSEENANSELRDSVSLRYSYNISDILTENVVGQDDDKNKAINHQRKKKSLKHVPTENGKAIPSLDGQVNQVAIEDLKGANATKADLVQGGSVIDTPADTVENALKKTKRSSKTRTPKVQQINHFTHGEDSNSTKGSKGKYLSYIGDIETHSNETAVGVPTQSPAVQEDATTLRTSTSNARKGRKKSSKTELQSRDSALDRDSDADLMNYGAECITVSSKRSADAVEPNERISFIDHFSPNATNDPYVYADNKKSNEEGTVREVEDNKKKIKMDMQSQHVDNVEPNDLLDTHHIEKTRLTNYFPGDVGVPSYSAENMNRVDGSVKKIKEKKKRKMDLLKSVPQQANPSGDQDINNGLKSLLFSDAQEGRTEQDTKDNNNNVIQKNSMLTHDPKNATCDSTLGNVKQSNIESDSQSNFPIDKDYARTKKEQKKSTSLIKHHSESKAKNYDGSINERTDQNSKSVRNLVKSFSMSPPASGDSTQRTPQNVRRRLAVRKVPRKRYEQINDKSKKASGTGAIFNDAISESSDDELDTATEKATIETSSDDSSISADSGISSSANDGSGVPDDDGNVSLSQKSLKEGLHIGSILRGSCSYKKARKKQAEQLDDTEVPDSQPMDSL